MNIPLGVALSVASSLQFVLLYYLSTWLVPMSGSEVFGWRIVLALPFVAALMRLSGEWRQVGKIGRRIRRKPRFFAALCLSSFLLGTQQWLFLWAPLNNAALDVSLGYFLMPLTMLLVGRFAYKERLSRMQNIAALMALAGVGHALFRLGGLSWETALVAIGFPAYFVLRKELKTNNAGGFWFDILLSAPVALVLILARGAPLARFAENPSLAYLIPLVGAMSAVSWICYTGASRMLPFGLFGLIGYVEPALLFCVSILIGETVKPEEFMTYGPIMLALLLLIVDGSLNLRHLRVPARFTPGWPQRKIAPEPSPAVRDGDS